ncbi:MAG: hypothetical protein NTV61_04120 [Candidatus Bathyarchaeota archaeon]|nr:hypothetical protein [Candidatus Bathyarchaeota archaeon]
MPDPVPAFCPNCGTPTTAPQNTSPEVPYQRNEIASENIPIKIKTPEYLGALSGLLGAIGSFLPWATMSSIFGTISLNGLDKDGMFTLIFSIAALGVLYLGIKRTRKNTTNIVIIILGIFLALTGIMDSSSITSIQTTQYAYIQVGVGLYLVILSGIGLVVSGIWNRMISQN